MQFHLSSLLYDIPTFCLYNCKVIKKYAHIVEDGAILLICQDMFLGIINMYIFVAPTVSFGESAYTVDEYDGPALLAVILSNPSSTDITVKVLTTDGSAIGNCSELLQYL